MRRATAEKRTSDWSSGIEHGQAMAVGQTTAFRTIVIKP
jgi:hypothetical protein